MTWLTWRQHRAQAAAAAGVLLLLAVFLVITGRQMSGYLHSTGLDRCLSQHGSCDPLARLFEDRYGGLLQYIPYLSLLPVLVGMFVGAPLLAREYELGTDLLAWSQSVSRRRWLAVQLAACAAGAIAAAAGFSLLFGWWYGPFGLLPFYGGQSRIQPGIFDAQGIVPVGYTLFALALGVAAGAVLRRTLPAMAVTVAGFLAARFGILAVRGHLITPVHATAALDASGSANPGTPLVPSQDWAVSSEILDRHGHIISAQQVEQSCPTNNMGACFTSHGYHQLNGFQPLTRFWPLQGIEFGIFAALTALLLAGTVWAVTHRPRPRLAARPSGAGARILSVPGPIDAADPDGSPMPEGDSRARFGPARQA
jgi:hypothetical protein